MDVKWLHTYEAHGDEEGATIKQQNMGSQPKGSLNTFSKFWNSLQLVIWYR